MAMRMFVHPRTMAPDRPSDRVTCMNTLLAPLNLKVQDSGYFRVKDKAGNLTRSDGFNLDFKDKNMAINRYDFGRLRKATYFSGAHIQVRPSKEMIQNLELTPCCYKALDLVRATPGACMCTSEKAENAPRTAKLHARKRAREEALAEQALLHSTARVNLHRAGEASGAGPSGA